MRIQCGWFVCFFFLSRFLAEFLLSDIVEFVLHYIRQTNMPITPGRMGRIARFLVTFVGATNYVKNPYVRGKMAEVLCVG